MKKLFVTGGAGFIGSNFIRYWLTEHAESEVVNFDKLTYAGNLSSLRDIADNPRYQFVQGDICEAAAVEKAMIGCDTVVHFAAETHVDRSVTGPMDFVQTNLVGTANLLQAARASGNLRFHHISTDEVFGSLALDGSDKFDEHTPYDPRSPYSASKAGSDHLVRAFHETYGLPVTISNCSNNYGAYHYPEKLFPLAITNLLEGKNVPVYGSGLQIRDWLHVEDHARAIDLILQQGTIGETYCIGGMNKDITNLDAVRAMLTIMDLNESRIEYVTDRPGHDQRYSVDWSKIHRELGWSPLRTFEEGLAQTIEWYKKNEWWWKPIKNGKFKEYYDTHYAK
jgi:dTDP-glucose 4,6-dehydratase